MIIPPFSVTSRPDEGIEIENLLLDYDGIDALRGVTAALSAGVFVAVLGPSGSGLLAETGLVGGPARLALVDGTGLARLGPAILRPGMHRLADRVRMKPPERQASHRRGSESPVPSHHD